MNRGTYVDNLSLYFMNCTLMEASILFELDSQVSFHLRVDLNSSNHHSKKGRHYAHTAAIASPSMKFLRVSLDYVPDLPGGATVLPIVDELSFVPTSLSVVDFPFILIIWLPGID